jgi:hypothetical protein
MPDGPKSNQAALWRPDSGDRGLARDKRKPASPRPAKPSIIVTQVAGSGSSIRHRGDDRKVSEHISGGRA